ncbi:ankyrin [Apiospora kogelbergensis]|uniref:Ankyrin n=1 Tax=Apiospora kogelbergensis TaxID=1337665 RepID=A0AAW0QEH9_9PEZI
MNLLKLPRELIDEILYQATLCRDDKTSVKRSLRMRLVCKYFAEAVYPALFRTHRLDDAIFKCCFPNYRYKLKRYGVRELWQRYLVYRVTLEQDPTVGRFVEVRDLARILCGEYASLDYRSVVETLCSLALDNVERGPAIFREWGSVSCDKTRPNTNIFRPLYEEVAPDPRLNLLAAAVRLDLPALVEQLLAEGHSPARPNFLFPPATQVAAECGNEALLRLLLEAREKKGLQPLDASTVFGASVAGRLDLLKLVLSPAGASFPHACGCGNGAAPQHSWQTTLLSRAMTATESPAVYEYLEAAWAPGYLRGTLHHELDLVSHAGRGNPGMVRYFLDQRGVPVDGVEEHGNMDTALAMAVGSGHDDVVDLLLERGADVNWARTPKGSSIALRSAVRQGHVGLARKLLARGAELRWNVSGERWTMQAAFHLESADMVRLLVERGAPLDDVAPKLRADLLGLGYETMVDLLDTYTVV